jgi:methionyl-tRNA formyltransferase
MGRKKGASDAFRTLLQRGHHIAAVVPSDGHSPGASALEELARSRGVPVATNDEIHIAAEGGCSRDALAAVDLIISYLHNRKIRPALIRLPRLGCFNFHPAPLPEFRGLGGYNFAILERMPYYGVSAHWVAEGIDEGDIVRVKRFPIDPDAETALSLEAKSQAALLDLFVEFLEMIEGGEPVPAIPQGSGRYIGRREMEEAKRIGPDESAESVDRKARAFWFPPFTGAFLEIRNRQFTIVPDCVLKELERANRTA